MRTQSSALQHALSFLSHPSSPVVANTILWFHIHILPWRSLSHNSALSLCNSLTDLSSIHWTELYSKSSQRYHTTDGQPPSLSWYQATVWDPQQFFFYLIWKLYLDSCAFLIMRCPLWWEDESVVYSYDFFWAGFLIMRCPLWWEDESVVYSYDCFWTGFLIMRCPLWWEDESVVYSYDCFWAGFLIMRCPLWWEDESVVYSYSCFWALLAQSLLGSSPTELLTVILSLSYETPPNLEGQAPIFVSPRNRVVQLYPQTLVSLFITSYDILTCLHAGSELWYQVAHNVQP
jgi:hypothetical protein